MKALKLVTKTLFTSSRTAAEKRSTNPRITAPSIGRLSEPRLRKAVAKVKTCLDMLRNVHHVVRMRGFTDYQKCDYAREVAGHYHVWKEVEDYRVRLSDV